MRTAAQQRRALALLMRAEDADVSTLFEEAVDHVVVLHLQLVRRLHVHVHQQPQPHLASS